MNGSQQRNMSGGPPQYSGFANNHSYGQAQPPQPLRPAQTSQNSRAEAFDDEKKRIIASCFSKKDDRGTLLQSYITHIRVEEDGAFPSDPPPVDADAVHKKSRVIIAAVKMSGRVFLHKARENEDRTFQIGKTWPMEELQVIESFSASVQRDPRGQERSRLAGESGFALTIMKPYFWKAKTPKEKAFFIGSLVKIYKKYTNGKLPSLVGFDRREERDIIAASESSQRQHQHSPGRSPAPAPAPPPPMPYAQQRPSGSSTSLQSQEQGAPRHRPSDVSAESSGRSPSVASSVRQRPPSPNHHRNEIPPLQPGHYGAPSPLPTSTGRSATPKLRQQTSQESHLRSRPSQEQPRRTDSPLDMPLRLNQPPSRSNLSSPAPEERNDHRMPSSRYGSEAPDFMKDPPRSPGLMASPHDSYSVTSATSERWRPPGAASRTASGALTERQHTPRESIASNLSGPSHPSFVSDRSNPNLPIQGLPERRRPPLENNSFGPQKPPSQGPIEEDMPKPLRTPKPKQEAPTRSPPREDTPPRLEPKMPGAFGSPSPSRSRTPPPPLQTDMSSPQKPSNSKILANGQVPKPDESKSTILPQKSGGLKPSPFGRKSEDTKPTSSSLKSEESKPSPHTAAPPAPCSETPEPKADKAEPTSPGQTKPGLGPMVGKKFGEKSNAMANWGKAKKAATAAKAFTPRAGGAGSRLRAQKEQPSNEPDGVTGVVPAPLTRAPVGDSVSERVSLEKPRVEETPDLQVTSASPSRDQTLANGRDSLPAVEQVLPVSVQKPSHEFEYQYDKALKALGVDPEILGGQGREFEATLTEFGWGDNILLRKTVDKVEAGLRREIARLEAGPWLGHDSDGGGQKDAGVEIFEKALDKSIHECDELDKLMSLYSVELATLNDDIALIEFQANGLQVITANQRMLQMELQERIGREGGGY